MDVSQQLLSDITAYMKYAKYIPSLSRREPFIEIVDRNKNMHLKKFPELREQIEAAYTYVYNRTVLPSMRSMQFAGKPIELNNSRIFNCSYLPIDDYRAFSETMFLLLSGCGVGYSVQKHHVEKLQELKKPDPKKHRKYLINDSIEGWSDAIKMLMKSYFSGGSTIRFVYDDIRPKGSLLITSGGKAPGPEPLRLCIEKIRAMLNNMEDGHKLSPIQVHDIVCHLADAVLAGGIRRAALISLFNMDDDEMISCKTGNWWELNPQRGRANNSAVILRHRIEEDEFMSLWDRIQRSGSGEPGIYLTHNNDLGTNPCCFIGETKIDTDNGTMTIIDIVNSINSGNEVVVKTYNERTNTIEYNKVLNGILTKINANVYRLDVESNGLFYNVIATPDHKFYTEERGWVELKSLEIDETLISSSLGKYKVHSIEILQETYDVYDIEVENNHNFFANGILAHNCEISLKPFQYCNLCEVNISDIKSQEDLNDRVRAAAFIGTLQASYTDFHYLRPIWQKTTEKDALIGVGLTGIASGEYSKYNLTEAANVVNDENERVANLIGINKASRTCTVKPSGTASIVMGCSSGIHAWHNDYYIRRIRVMKNESMYSYLIENHPEIVEDEYFSPHDTAVISIPQKAPLNSIMRTESPIDLLDRVKHVYKDWIKPGHRKGHNTNNISATVSIKDDEWDEVGKWMWNNRKFYNGISVLPYDGGSYIQAPFENITEDKYNELVANLHMIDLNSVIETDDNTDLAGELACVGGGSCEIF